MLAIFVSLGVGCGDDSAVGNNGDSEETNEEQAVSCEDRSSCTAEQECVDGVCTSHLECNVRQARSDWSSFFDEAHCAADWKECDNSKTYTLECKGDTRDDYVPCKCIVNDVEVSEFSMLNEGECADDQLHRIANEGCGWIVPEAHRR